MSTKNKAIIRFLTRTRNKVIKSWCRGTFAKNKHGHPVNIASRNATSFCLVGAMLRSRPKGNVWIHREVGESIANLVSPDKGVHKFGGAARLVQWNDSKKRTKSQVIALLDKTIAYYVNQE